MKIYLTPNTAGRYGGALNGNLRHLDRFILSELNNSEFKSSFDELWLTLSYPPMYILPGVVGMEVTFKKYYDTFPYSRLNRRYKKIDLTLKAPEFSEHLDKEEQEKYKHKFEIEPQFKNITEAELGQILIDKYLEAGEIISSKLKKEDVFDIELFNQVLLTIKHKINPDFLQKLNDAQKVEVKDDTLNRANQLRSERQKTNKPKNKLIRDLRVYYNGLPNKALYPYDYIYTEIFLNLLAREGLKCPTYHHLYIQVATTIDDALKNSFSIEDWYVNGLAVIDYNKFQTLSDKEKENEVFKIILEGLKDIANIDKLDTNIIDTVANTIKEKGKDTELHFKTIENDNYKLVITYFSRSMEDQCPVFFNITDKTKNITKRLQIGKADNTQLFLWLQKITLNNKKIKIKSSDSIRGQVWLKGKPTELEFEIAELLK
ncbi:MAG TPA: hypothetical protein PKA00_15615 [Saprospiraceae bacterium]|nr:hypothetical protein [Saprospiraceae bacterium]HMQ84341.1 hypothetical protein [Saprospiraceae bacterium]